MKLSFHTNYAHTFLVDLGNPPVKKGNIRINYALDDGSNPKFASYTIPFSLIANNKYQTNAGCAVKSRFVIPQMHFPALIKTPTISIASNGITITCTGSVFAQDIYQPNVEELTFKSAEWQVVNKFIPTDKPAMTVNGTIMSFTGQRDMNYNIQVRYHAGSVDFPDEVSAWSDIATVYIPKIDNSQADQFNANFKSQNPSVYIEDGTNLAGLNTWTNDDFGYGEFSDGSRLSAVLSGSPQHNYLFFGNPEPFKNWQPAGEFNPFGTTWNGGFVIIREKCSISGIDLNVDNIVYTCCSSSSLGGLFVFDNMHALLTNQHRLQVGFPEKTNDPRITIDYANKQFLCSWVISANARGYKTARLIDAKSGQWTTPKILQINYNNGQKTYACNRDECSGPLTMDGEPIFYCSFQQDSSKGLEGDFIFKVNGDYDSVGIPWSLNLGTYNYAASVSNYGLYGSQSYTDATGKQVVNTGFRTKYTVSNFSWDRHGRNPVAVGTFIDMFLNNDYFDFIVPAGASVSTIPNTGTLSFGGWTSNPVNAGAIIKVYTWQSGDTYQWNVYRQEDANGNIVGHSSLRTVKLTGIGSGTDGIN